MATYSKASPYYSTGTYGGYLDVLNYRSFPAQPDDQIITLTESYRNRPDLLAFDLYQDSRLWWVFAVRNPNNIKNPVFDFVPGRKIYVPKKETLTTALGL
jgi:hypothetical protein